MFVQMNLIGIGPVMYASSKISIMQQVKLTTSPYQYLLCLITNYGLKTWQFYTFNSLLLLQCC
jgi:hypothetical protein